MNFCILLLSISSLSLSPAEISIQKAKDSIAQHPKHVPYYNALAMAYARRARETSDPTFYGEAEKVVEKSLELSPDNFEALKVRTWLLLGRHEFAKAREQALILNKKTPDDITVYGYMADANVELGNYKEAVEAAQWMLNLRAGNIAGLTRAAYLRELHGYLPGAMELMRTAYDATPYQETEERAWLLSQMAHLQLISGNLKDAEMHAKGALDLFQNYHYALGVLGQVRTAQKRYPEAVELLQRRYAAAPHAENQYSLAVAQQRAGQDLEAKSSFVEFEAKALLESGTTDNANHELIAYYVDVAKAPEKALKIATEELKRRQDIHTLDAYAWTRAAMGDLEAADAHMRRAIAVGGKDPNLLYHASVIARRMKRVEEANKLLQQAAAGYSPEALQALSTETASVR